MTRFTSIESLRGIAALLVLFAHVKFPVIDACGVSELPAVLRPSWGACGVDLFFVISGFVISLTLDKTGISWRGFVAARAARVVPVYFVFTLVCLAIPAVVCVPLTGKVVADSFLFLPLFDTDRFAGTVHPYGWTLSFEIWFYLVATVIAVIAGPRAVPVRLAAGFITCSLVLLAVGYEPSWYFPRFVLCPLVIEFALGCVAYRITARSVSRGLGLAILAAGLAGLVLASFRGDRLATYAAVLADPNLALERVVCWGMPSFLIVTGATAIERRIGWWPWQRAAVFVGGLSFSLYLVQPIILFVIGSLGQSIGGLSPWVVAGVAAIAAFLTAAITYRVVELPLVAWTRRRLEGWLGVSRPDRSGQASSDGRRVSRVSAEVAAAGGASAVPALPSR
jgi:exopolysaccharide production protein ExoZ